MKKFIAMIATVLALTACHAVPEGSVGLRTNFDKTVETTELVAGSFNQTFVGSVEDFPIREIPMAATNMQPPASDGAPMGDFDVTVVYSLNPKAVSDLYINKSKGFHAEASKDGGTLLMYSYLQTTVRNAVYKAAQEYDSITMNSHRNEIEAKIRATVQKTLMDEKLDTAITIGQVQVKSIEPPASVKAAAVRLVAAKAENAAKDIEIDTAKKEAERIAALNANPGAISYMNAQAQMAIAEGVRDGKVQTVVVPYDFKGIVNTGK